MKNRLHAHRRKNGKFWCDHTWQAMGKVGPDWDLHVGVKILCMCIYCSKLRYFSNRSLKEVPDHLIDETISYF